MSPFSRSRFPAGGVRVVAEVREAIKTRTSADVEFLEIGLPGGRMTPDGTDSTEVGPISS